MFSLAMSLIRMKDVAQEQYTQAEAERAAGMTREKYPPAHSSNSRTSAPGAQLAGESGVTLKVAEPAGEMGMDDEDPDL